jgi:hypothetical protein
MTSMSTRVSGRANTRKRLAVYAHADQGQRACASSRRSEAVSSESESDRPASIRLRHKSCRGVSSIHINILEDHVPLPLRLALQPCRALAKAPPAILRGGLTSAVTPGPVWPSSSCFVTAAVVLQSSYEVVLGNRLLLPFVKLRCDLAWHTSNRAACRTALEPQGSTMGRRGRSTRCKVSILCGHTAGMILRTGAHLGEDSLLICVHAQASCASSKSNGTTMSAPATLGILNAPR